MCTRNLILALAIAVCSNGFAQELTLDELVGVWNFVAYAEVESPADRISMSAQMDFRDDGTVITMRGGGSTEAAFSINGNTIVYTDGAGQQIWNIRSFTPGNELIVEYQRGLMFFEKP